MEKRGYATRRYVYRWPDICRRFIPDRRILNPQQQDIFMVLLLARGRVVTFEDFYMLFWYDDPEGGPLCYRKIIQVQVSLMNKILGGGISNKLDIGYYIHDQYSSI